MAKRATRRLTIPITQEVINNAVERDSAHCVIADSISAALPDVKHVNVDLQTVRFTTEDGTRYVYLTPSTAQELLVRFDQGHKPEPGSMYLSRPIQIVPYRDRGAEAPREVKVKPVNKGKGHGGVEVTVIGGHLPPTAALSNRRGRVRRFGMRTLKP